MQKFDKSALTRNHLVTSTQENEKKSHVNNIKRQTQYIIFVIQKIRSQTINEGKKRKSTKDLRKTKVSCGYV